jgi:hypothetical protein
MLWLNCKYIPCVAVDKNVLQNSVIFLIDISAGALPGERHCWEADNLKNVCRVYKTL